MRRPNNQTSKTSKDFVSIVAALVWHMFGVTLFKGFRHRFAVSLSATPAPATAGRPLSCAASLRAFWDGSATAGELATVGRRFAGRGAMPQQPQQPLGTCRTPCPRGAPRRCAVAGRRQQGRLHPAAPNTMVPRLCKALGRLAAQRFLARVALTRRMAATPHDLLRHRCVRELPAPDPRDGRGCCCVSRGCQPDCFRLRGTFRGGRKRGGAIPVLSFQPREIKAHPGNCVSPPPHPIPQAVHPTLSLAVVVCKTETVVYDARLCVYWCIPPFRAPIPLCQLM